MSGIIDLLKLGSKLVGHKISQHNAATGKTEVVTTAYGQVKGMQRRTIYDELFYAFEGIPYAKPPLGELRFRAPQAPDPWMSVRDCTNSGDKPLQQHMVLKFTIGTEDCLTLNVYTKTLKSSQPLPVMVFIYGGSFQFGEASRDYYAPDYFMEENVVLVNMNYRVGALGFLSLEDPDLDVPGNAGLKDILMALRWVKQNIGHFNGDANNITLFGESAGSASVHYMMISERAKGLFHKAILQSGTVHCPWAHSTHYNWAYRLAHELGYKGANNDKEVFRYLSKVDGRKLATADKRLCTRQDKDEHVFFAFNPVVEPYESDFCILSKPFVEMQADTWSKDIPIMVGGTSFEGLYAYPHKNTDPYLINELNWELILPIEVRQACNPAELREMGLRLKHTYFGNEEPNIKYNYAQYLDLMSYKYFWEGINRTLHARLKYSPHTPNYLFRFDFDSPFFNHYRFLHCGKNVRGVSHADDISYLFYNIMATKLDKQTPEYKTIQRMIGMWTSFAANDNPNCAAIAPVRWEPVESEDDQTGPKCLNISNDLTFIELPEKKKLRVWESFYVHLKQPT